MIAIEIFNAIASGEDGTVDTTSHDLPQHGYFVGGHGEPLVYDSPEHANRSTALAEIIAFVEGCEARFIGWWTDSDDGKVYIDGTSWHVGHDEAERVCRERGEIAFWGIEHQREFRPVVQGPEEVAFEVDGETVAGGKAGETWNALYTIPGGVSVATEAEAEAYDIRPRFVRADKEV